MTSYDDTTQSSRSDAATTHSTLGTATYTNADDLSYSPSGDPAVDVAEYRDETTDIPPDACGADNLPTGVDNQEGAAAARPVDTGRVSKDEVDDLLSRTSEEWRSKTGTQGVKNDAFEQEAALDAVNLGERTWETG